MGKDGNQQLVRQAADACSSSGCKVPSGGGGGGGNTSRLSGKNLEPRRTPHAMRHSVPLAQRREAVRLENTSAVCYLRRLREAEFIEAG